MPMPSFWAALPFTSLLLALLIGPGLLPRVWHRPLWRLGLLLVLCSPAAFRDALQEPARLGHALDEYASFLLLLWALYQLASGIVLEGPFCGSPRSNLLLLTLGTLSASVIGTTGASMLFLPVLLRANQGRLFTTHLIVLFIFLVSNVGGLLLPLGDPPLFLGFLHGVPFFWTLRLWPAWLLNVGGLLCVVYALDVRAYRRESAAFGDSQAARGRTRWRVRGGRHALGFVAVTASLVFSESLGGAGHGQQIALLAIALASLLSTPHEVRVFNQFSWEPLIEVAVLFLPLFLAMPQALDVVAQLSSVLPLHSNEAFFWVTGILSSVLDNAPCYLSFATLANAQHGHFGSELSALVSTPAGSATLMAIAHGAVCMGAVTYIGNGPNLMVRARALEAGFGAPSFLAYVGWATVVLLPVLAASRLLLALV